MAIFGNHWRDPNDPMSSTKRNLSDGELQRPGKTRYERENGITAQHEKNKAGRATFHRQQAGKNS